MKSSRRASWGVLLASVFVIIAAGLRPARADWSVFRGGATNSGVSDVSLDNASAAEPWSFATAGLVWGTPVIDSAGNSYVGSSDKHFYKLDRAGKLVWSAAILDRPDALIDSAAALAGGGTRVIVPGGDGYLHAYDTTTGVEVWSFKATGAADSDQSSGVVVNSFEGNVQLGPNGLAYAGSDNGRLYALDPADGRLVWSFATRMMVWSSPVFDAQSRWLAFGSLDHHVYLLDPATGRRLDAFDAGSDVKASLATDGKGSLYFGDAAGRFYRLEVIEKDGHFRLRKAWSRSIGGELYSSAALTPTGAVFGTESGRVHCLDESGRTVWTYVTHSPVSGSPVVSRDGTVIVGAKNGMLYALDARDGTRRWSFATTRSQLKSNVDSSPVLRDDGTIVVGSYNGLVHFVPAGFCPAHREDSRCRFGGREDTPDFGAPIGDDEATVRLILRDGTFSKAANDVGALAPIALKLVAFEKGHLLDRAAIDALGLSVSFEPPVKFKSQVSSDGGALVVLPERLAPSTRYRVAVRGHYYQSTSWLADRFKWLGLHAFAGEVTLTTGDQQILLPLPRHWAMGSLYLKQPQSLDTYIPAGLDGQAYVGTPFASTGPDGRFLILMLPALPAEPAPLPLVEPARAFVLEAERVDNELRATGAMTVSAMGGTIPFRHVALTAKIGDRGTLEGGEFVTEASCLALRGNGSAYRFPYQLLAQTCDYGLRLFGLGTFVGRPLATLAAPPRDAGHLVSVVRYNPSTLRVTGTAFAVSADGHVPPGLKLRAGPGKESPADRTQIFIDSDPVPADK